MARPGNTPLHPLRHPRRLPLTAILAALFSFAALSCVPPAGARTYATWNRYEADKLAAAWLIKRFVDPAAEFVFLPPGASLPAGAIPFDVPGAVLARTAGTTTYAAVRRHYRLEDPILARIGLFINDLELNVWEEKAFPESREIAEMLAAALRQNATPKQLLTRTFQFFDKLYAELNGTMVPSR